MTHNCSIKVNNKYVIRVKQKPTGDYKVYLTLRNGLIKDHCTTKNVNEIAGLIYHYVTTYKYSK